MDYFNQTFQQVSFKRGTKFAQTAKTFFSPSTRPNKLGSVDGGVNEIRVLSNEGLCLSLRGDHNKSWFKKFTDIVHVISSDLIGCTIYCCLRPSTFLKTACLYLKEMKIFNGILKNFIALSPTTFNQRKELGGGG